MKIYTLLTGADYYNSELILSTLDKKEIIPFIRNYDIYGDFIEIIGFDTKTKVKTLCIHLRSKHIDKIKSKAIKN